jgi:hypothetical protein
MNICADRSGIWTIVSGWLDPVVAGKVVFTKTDEELAAIIPPELVPAKEWEWEYVEQVPGENKLLEDTDTHDDLQQERLRLARNYEEATLTWVNPTGPDCDEAKSFAIDRRKVLAEQLRQNYWHLDPYVRARSYLDRKGILGPHGVLNFYPSAGNTKIVDYTNEIDIEMQSRA